MKINKRTIVDVRTAEAFAAGHPSGSINIPLEQLEERAGEIRKLPAPVILCSGTGNRSAKAETLLKTHAIFCIDGGSWSDVDLFLEASR